jgi:proton-translocating NADH-quinone oxidoreductase chain N
MQNLLFVLPQILLLLTASLVFGLDLVGRRDKKWLPDLALFGVSAVLGAGVYLLGWAELPEAPILGGMLVVDPFTIYFQIFAAVVAGLVIALAVDYLPGRTPYPNEFYTFLLVANFAISLAAAAADLVMLFVAFELLSVTSYLLTGYLRKDPRSNEAAMKYFLYGAMASAAMLYGMSLLYGAAASTSLAQIADTLQESGPGLTWVGFPALVLMMVGLGFKIGAVPFHQWAPDAFEGAPTPITAFLAVGSKAAGFAVLVRVMVTAFPNFQTHWVALLTAISLMTMTLGNLVAISQKDIKRMLAYSSVAHAGYMLLGLISWSPGTAGGIFDGISGLLIYLLVYLFGNLGAFAVVIALEESEGTTRIEDYAGLRQRSPLAAGTMLIFMLSLTGIPGTGGFIGKLFVFGAAIRAEYYLLAIAAIVNSVVAAFYYLNVVRYMFFNEPEAAESAQVRIPGTLNAVLIISCVMILVTGLMAQPFITFVRETMGLLTAF